MAERIDSLTLNMREDRYLWILTDSKTSIDTLETGPGLQLSVLGNRIWQLLDEIVGSYVFEAVKFQWVPGHSGVKGN